MNDRNEIVGVFNASDLRRLVESAIFTRKIVYPPKKEPYRRPPTPWRYKKDKTGEILARTGKPRDTGIWEVWVGDEMIGRLVPVYQGLGGVSWSNPDKLAGKATWYNRYEWLGGTRDGAAQKLYERWQATQKVDSDDTGPT